MPRIYALDTNAVIFYVTDEQKACEKLVPIIQDPDTRLIIPAIAHGAPLLTRDADFIRVPNLLVEII